MKELNLEETKIVSGGHRASVRQLHASNGKDPVPGQGVGLDKPHLLPVPATHGGWGKGGING